MDQSCSSKSWHLGKFPVKASAGGKRLQQRYFGEEALPASSWFRVIVPSLKKAGEKKQGGEHHWKSPRRTGKFLLPDVALPNSRGRSSYEMQHAWRPGSCVTWSPPHRVWFVLPSHSLRCIEGTHVGDSQENWGLSRFLTHLMVWCLAFSFRFMAFSHSVLKMSARGHSEILWTS